MNREKCFYAEWKIIQLYILFCFKGKFLNFEKCLEYPPINKFLQPENFLFFKYIYYFLYFHKKVNSNKSWCVSLILMELEKVNIKRIRLEQLWKRELTKGKGLTFANGRKLIVESSIKTSTAGRSNEEASGVTLVLDGGSHLVISRRVFSRGRIYH